MWCPPEYLLLCDISDAVGARAWAETSKMPDPADLAEFEYSSDMFAPDWRDDRVRAVVAYTLARFIDHEANNFFVLDESANVMRLSGRVMAQAKTFDGPFPETIREWRQVAQFLMGALVNVSEEDFSIDPNRYPKTERRSEFPEFVRFDNFINRIAGKSVFWRLPEPTMRIEKVVDYALEVSKFDATLSNLHRHGAGNSLEVIWNHVWLAFPNGKGENTWSFVEKRVGYSRRSIIRALEQFGGQEKWATGGQAPD